MRTIHFPLSSILLTTGLLLGSHVALARPTDEPFESTRAQDVWLDMHTREFAEFAKPIPDPTGRRDERESDPLHLPEVERELPQTLALGDRGPHRVDPGRIMSPIPEPGTSMLTLVGLLAVIWCVRRRSSN